MEQQQQFKSSNNNGASTTSKKMSIGLITCMCFQFILAAYAAYFLYFFPASVLNPNISTKTTSRYSYSLCERKSISFEHKEYKNSRLLQQKNELFQKIVGFQNSTRECENLKELMAVPSSSSEAKITVIINHSKSRTLCAQIEALLGQSKPFHRLRIVSKEEEVRSIVTHYNDSRISFVSSVTNFKSYAKFHMALEADGADYVYVLEDYIFPGKRALEIFAHVAGTQKYANSVLGSSGRILPFMQQDSKFPSYAMYESMEAGLYLASDAHGIVVEHLLEVDFLIGGWFLSASLVQFMFMEKPFSFDHGDNLHLSYQLQKYRNAKSYVLPFDTISKKPWIKNDEPYSTIKDNRIEMRDKQWWQYVTRGFITQWAKLYPQHCHVIFYAHTLADISDLAPLIHHFMADPNRISYVMVSGGTLCPCEEASTKLGWSKNSCYERKFKIFDLDVGYKSTVQDQHHLNQLYTSVKGLIEIHNPYAIITVDDIDLAIASSLRLAVQKTSKSMLINLPRQSIPYTLWIAEINPTVLKEWNTMKITIAVITQNRAKSLRRLMDSIAKAYYLGDKITLSINMDSAVDEETLNMVNDFAWAQGEKFTRRRTFQGGLVRAVSESWYPSSDNDFGLLLEDDIELSPLYYMWLKYALLKYYYDPEAKASLPELNSIALHTPSIVEVVKHRPRWNATDFFKNVLPNTPYFHQLPCSWGALFLPQKWREFCSYIHMRYTRNPRLNPVQIPGSMTNGWGESWKRYMIDLMYLRGYVTLYPNFPQQMSFATNHMELGVHTSQKVFDMVHNRKDFEVALVKEDFLKLLPHNGLPSISQLPIVDLFNNVASIKQLKSAGSKLEQDVLQCNSTGVVKVDIVTGKPIGCEQF